LGPPLTRTAILAIHRELIAATIGLVHSQFEWTGKAMTAERLINIWLRYNAHTTSL